MDPEERGHVQRISWTSMMMRHSLDKKDKLMASEKKFKEAQDGAPLVN